MFSGASLGVAGRPARDTGLFVVPLAAPLLAVDVDPLAVVPVRVLTGFARSPPVIAIGPAFFFLPPGGPMFSFSGSSNLTVFLIAGFASALDAAVGAVAVESVGRVLVVLVFLEVAVEEDWSSGLAERVARVALEAGS